jgi:hypothetical protein
MEWLTLMWAMMELKKVSESLVWYSDAGKGDLRVCGPEWNLFEV